MITKVKTLAHVGLVVTEVICECQIANGLPVFNIVGMADKNIQESKERVRVVLNELTNYDEKIYYPYSRITVNLAPAEMVKKGNHYDLAILIAILEQQGYFEKLDLTKYFFLGEISLDGSINRIDNIINYCLFLNEYFPKSIIFLPQENSKEASYLTNGNIYTVSHINQILDILKNKSSLLPVAKENLNVEEFFETENSFEDIIGQKQAKRAVEIATAGGHNLLLVGEQGSGKTLLVRTMQSILPSLDSDELIEVAKIRSLVGLKAKDILSPFRPFRNPHHTSSLVSIIGGGNKITAGEITKAHLGILFLDELTEFNKYTLDSLRQPLEDKIVNIARANSTVSYPCNFQLIATMNPSSKGSFEKNIKLEANSGMKKISGPILDRFDLQVKMFKPKNLNQIPKDKTTTQELRTRITIATQIQRKRGVKNSNLNLSQIKTFCVLDEISNTVLEQFQNDKDLSMRGYHKILRVARTIADLDNSNNIEYRHVIESLQFKF